MGYTVEIELTSNSLQDLLGYHQIKWGWGKIAQAEEEILISY